MAFRTKLDFSNNRQVKQFIETTTVLSGATNFGVPFNELPSGPNLVKVIAISANEPLTNLFTSTATETNVVWEFSDIYGGDLLQSEIDVRTELMNMVSSMVTNITLTNSGTTQSFGPIYSASTTTIIDKNEIALGYHGVSFDMTVIEMVPNGSGGFDGTVGIDEFIYYTANALDFSGRTIWVDVSGITRTQDLIITATGNTGDVWTREDAEGRGYWAPSAGSGSGTTIGDVSATIRGAVNNIPLQELGGVDKLINGIRIGRGNNNLENNLVIGEFSGQNITSGLYNTFMGFYSGNNNKIGLANTSVGADSLKFNTDGSFNTAIGAGALENNQGQQNTAIGVNALLNNIGVPTLQVNGGNNIAVGTSALLSNISGGMNLSIGNFSLKVNISGIGNVALGHQAGSGISTGGYNIILGSTPFELNGKGVTTGNHNTLISSFSEPGIKSGSYNVFIGKVTGESPTASNKIILADNSGNRAIEKLTNNTLLAPTQTIPLISGDTTGKSFVTKEYLEAYGGGTGTTTASIWENNPNFFGSAKLVGSSSVISNLYALAEGDANIASGQYSHAEGFETEANGVTAHSQGYQTKALGLFSHAEGRNTIASGDKSHAEGYNTIASGDCSHVEGNGSQANGYGSHAEGSSEANGDYSHAEGIGTMAIGAYSHSGGFETIASGETSFAIGISTEANGKGSFASGKDTVASGFGSTAGGLNSIASGEYSFAGGSRVSKASGYSSFAFAGGEASGFYSFAFGGSSLASENISVAFGGGKAIASGSTAMGYITIASGLTSFASGFQTIAGGQNSFSSGYKTIASGGTSFASGYLSKAFGLYSHAEGANTEASGQASHAEGAGTFAIGFASHAEGAGTLASREYCHAEGIGSQAIGSTSHAEGNNTYAGGDFSHSQNDNSTANGKSSHAGGSYSFAEGIMSFVHGEYSRANGNYSVVLGSNSAANSDNTVVLGSGISGNTADTTYVDKLNIKRFSTAYLRPIGVDSFGNVCDTTSDERLKENISPLTNALERVQKINGVSYNWKDRDAGGNGLRFGFIAQQLESVEPELVFTSNQTEEKYKGINDGGIIPLLVEAVKELATGTTLHREYLITQTIKAEDNNIELNFNGNKKSSINGGIKVLHGIAENNSSDLFIDEDGNWITNNDFKPKAITIPIYTPASSDDIFGSIGNVVTDDDYLYINTTTGWKRTKLENF